MIPKKIRQTPTDYQVNIAIDLYQRDGWDEFLFDENGFDIYIKITDEYYTKLLQSEEEISEFFNGQFNENFETNIS